MTKQSDMVHIGDGLYLTEEEAYQRGYEPRLERPIKGEPFFPRGALFNFIGLVALILFAVYANHWIGSFIRNLF